MGFMRFVLDKRAMFIFMSAALFIAGVFSFRSLPIEPYPNVSPLIVQVITQWPGRGAAEVEQQLTVPIEIAMAGVAGVDAIRSVSLFGLSIVTIKFVEGSDSFRARQNVTQKIGDATLPNGVDPNLSPDADAVGEILRYRLEGDSIDLITLKSLQDWELTKQIKLVPGVADIPGFGGLVKQYLIQPLPGKLQLYGISVNQLVQALTNANANVGGGLLSSGQQQFVVRGVGLLKSPEEMKEVIVAVNQGVPVRVRDLAEIKIGNAPRLGIVQADARSDIVEGIVLMRRGENATEVLGRVRERIVQINNGLLPPGVKVVPFYDRQHLLDLTTETVRHTLAVGMSLVLAVLFIFLGNLRAAAIVALVIPLALCFSFIAMYVAKVPANLISLGAIDFGIIVDAAVIVIENIMRRLEESGTALPDAIISGASEVMRPMIFSTSIMFIAYSPMFLFGGVEGVIFKPMAYTMGFALLASIILALSFVPSSTSFLFASAGHPHEPRLVEWLKGLYQPVLRRFVGQPGVVLLVMLALLGASLVGGSRLGTEFLPTLEENNYWIRVVLPNTVDLDYSVQISNRLRDFFRQQPEVANVVVQIGRPDDGTDSGGAFNQEYALYFKDPASWPAGSSKEGLRRRLEEYLNKIPGIDYNFSQYIQDNVAEALSGVKGANVVKLYGLDLDTLDDKAEEIQRVLKELPDVTDVGIFRELGQPTLNIQIDRAKCARFGLNVTDLQTLVQYAIGATPVTTVLEGEQRYDLVIRYPQQNRESADKIRGLLVDTPDGQRIPLGMVADVSLSGGPFFIYRENAKRYIAIKFSVNGRDLGGTVERAQRAVASQVQMESGYYMEWQGEFLQMKEAQRKLRWVIPLTLFGIFFMLYSAFGGAKDALIVLLNVPFSIIGGIAALYAAGETLSISAGIGFLSLFGIAILDGVILIACIRNLRAEGVKLAEAVMQGAMTRLRPVLMTASLAGLGLVPAALSHAIGSQAQKPLALVIVGGMASTTILTLLVLPVFYQWFYRRELNG